MIRLVQAIVLRAEDHLEYDRKLTLYTREFGKLRAKIVGVKKTASKLRGFSVPFVEAKLELYLHGTPRAGARDPGKIIGGELIDSHPLLRTDWEKMLETVTACETVDLLTHPIYPSPLEFELLQNSFRQMEESPHPILVRLRFTLILLRLLGYSLKHHPLWRSYSEGDRTLLRSLAKWECASALFSIDQIQRLEQMVSAYLSLHLPRPLQSEIFKKKLAYKEIK